MCYLFIKKLFIDNFFLKFFMNIMYIFLTYEFWFNFSVLLYFF